MADKTAKPTPPLPLGAKSLADQKKTRITYVIDNPFCQIEWPVIESKLDHNSILDLLCALLAPIGEHRRLYITPNASKGKRRKRQARAERKRQRLSKGGGVGGCDKMDVDADGDTDGSSGAKVELPIAPVSHSISSQSVDDTGNQASSNSLPSKPSEPPPPPTPPPPPPPEISNHVLIGLNTITAQLTALASTRLPPTFPQHLKLRPSHSKKKKKKPTNPTLTAPTAPPLPYPTTIFLTRADSQPTPLHAHLPMLTYLASLPSHPHPTLLVPLPKGAAAALSDVLAIPNANFIALSSTLPESGTAKTLLELVRRAVKPVSVPWLEGRIEEVAGMLHPQPQGPQQRDYQPLRVKKLRTTIGARKKKGATEVSGGNGSKEKEQS